MTATAAPAADTITAEIVYAVDNGEKIVNETFGPGNIRRRETGEPDRRACTIRNGRPLAGQFALEKNGFVFVRHDTAVRDFFDPEELRRVYYAEVRRLVMAACGAPRVEIFDHTLRSGDEDEREQRKIREPVLSAHNDYTEWSGPNRVRELFPDEADRLLARRFAIIQVWRPINRPIRRNPIAIADAPSVPSEDLLVAERRYPHRVGQTYKLRYNPAHRWYYFPEMRPDEAVVFKVYDSEKDGRARFTAHTSFDDPGTPAGAPARQSIEVRTFAFF